MWGGKGVTERCIHLQLVRDAILVGACSLGAVAIQNGAFDPSEFIFWQAVVCFFVDGCIALLCAMVKQVVGYYPSDVKDLMFAAMYLVILAIYSVEGPECFGATFVTGLNMVIAAVNTVFVVGYVLFDANINVRYWPSFYTHPSWGSYRKTDGIDSEDELELVSGVHGI